MPPIFVLGHKNPDTDAITSAVGYAALMRAQGQDAVAGRQGVLRPETAYVLKRFGVEAPQLITDVRPRVSDIMTSPALTVHQDTSLYEVGHLMQRNSIRVVPVVNDEGLLCGVMGVEDFASSFIGGLDHDSLDHVHLHLENVLRALDGRLLVHAPGRVLRDRVMVGAMEIDSMLGRLAPDILLVMGDREDAQRAAIEFGVGALVITGDNPVSEEILQLAREHNVSVIAVSHHTFTTVRLIHLSTSVRHVMRRDVQTCEPEDPVDEVAEKLRRREARSLVVTDGDGRVVGFVSRTNLLRQVRRQVVLVDHNERAQSAEGIEDADVIGVVDHHRVADFQTRTPPFMRLEPVGATSTIVAKLFFEQGAPLSAGMAGVLLAGIVTDTLIFRGPTTTQEDVKVAGRLAGIAGVEARALGEEIMRLASDVSERSAEQLLQSDFKEFSVEGRDFGISVIETTDAESVLSRRDDLLPAMRNLRGRGYSSIIFSIVDVANESTTLLVEGYEDDVAETFGGEREGDNTIHLPGILSRKKDLVPHLGTLVGRIDA
jgi:manganese-dependent inorganic pyrophosphatase